MPYKKTLILGVLIFLFSFGQIMAANPNNIQARIYIDTKAQWLKISNMHLDIVWHDKDYIEIITNDTELNVLNSHEFKTEIVHEDLADFYRSRLEPGKDMGGYKTLDEINTYIDGIIADHPDIVSNKVDIGQTIEGRTMWAFKVSDNPNDNEDEPEIMYTSAIHAREVITPEVMFHFIDYMTDNYGSNPDVAYLIDNREMWFVIVVNPDGYYHNEVLEPGGGGMWRKNRRNNGDGTWGVDLNRNYGYLWGYDDIGSSPYGDDQTYRGTGSFSEPETQNMRDFTIAHEFVITVYYHSYSNLILWPWGYDHFYTPDDHIFSAMGDSMSTFNGYQPTVSWGLYVANGTTDDWGYGEQLTKNKNFAFTFEVGSYSDNFWPPLSRIPELVSENLEPNLYLAKVAGNVYSALPPEAPVITLPDTVENISYNVEWSFDDTLNPAVYYKLVELQDFQKITDPAEEFNYIENNDFTITGDRYHSSPTSFYSGAADNISRYIQTAYSHNVRYGDTLRFWTYYDIEPDWDYAYTEVSTDGVSFTPIEGNITTDYNPNGNNRGNGITGSSGGWVEALFDLVDYIGESVYFRMSYHTDSYVSEEGFYVDDIYPVNGFGVENVISSTIVDTFYTFTDKPVGTYYYMVKAQDAESQWSVFSEVEKTVVSSQFFCGDFNDDETSDLLDILFLIQYKYKDGPAPDPMESADVNSDTNVDLLDILHLISYKYKEGPEPDCP